MENYLNNPMMNMFRKAMENPMEMWSMDNWTQLNENIQNSETYKNFNPGNWMTMSNKMMENLPWLKNGQNGFIFQENIKNMISNNFNMKHFLTWANDFSEQVSLKLRQE